MVTRFGVRGEFITLGQLLKATGLSRTGGDTKDVLSAGGIRVNGSLEDRRGAKLRANDVIIFATGETIQLVSHDQARAEEADGSVDGVAASDTEQIPDVEGKLRRLAEGKPRQRSLDASGQPKKTHTQTSKYATYGEYQKERRALRKEGRQLLPYAQKPGTENIPAGPRRGSSRPK